MGEGSLRFSMKKNSPTADWNLNDVSLSVYTMASVESAVTKIAGSMSSLSAGSISCAAYRTVDNTDVVVPSVTKNQVLYVLAAVQNTTEDLILGESLQGFRLEVSPGTATDNCAWNCRGYEDKINNATCICQETDTNEATSIVENVCELCDVNSTFCFWEYKSETVFNRQIPIVTIRLMIVQPYIYQIPLLTGAIGLDRAGIMVFLRWNGTSFSMQSKPRADNVMTKNLLMATMRVVPKPQFF